MFLHLFDAERKNKIFLLGMFRKVESSVYCNTESYMYSQHFWSQSYFEVESLILHCNK